MDSAVDSIARSLTRIKKSTKKVQNGKMKALDPGECFLCGLIERNLIAENVIKDLVSIFP